MKLIIELPERSELMAMNRQRWSEVIADKTLADLPFKVETNAHGILMMNPPPSGDHSRRQSQILIQLHQRLGGRALVECPISTIDGVKAADVAWYSAVRFAEIQGQVVFERAPEICVEVLSPSNTTWQMNEKKQLYFEAGAEEVWFCRVDGKFEFYHRESPSELKPQSALCPNFPSELAPD